MNPNNRPSDSAIELRRALELLCRKANPPWWPHARKLAFPKSVLGAVSSDAISLEAGYLRGMDDVTKAMPSGSDFFDNSLSDDVSLSPLLPLEGHEDRVSSITQLLDGRLASGSGLWDDLASGSYDNSIRIWDIEKQACVATLEGHEGSVYSITQLTDGRLASGSSDNSIRIWDIEKQACVATLEGHGGSVYSITQLSDGRLASGSSDNSIRIWDIEEQACVATLEGHEGEVLFITQLSDGRLGSGTRKGLILWSEGPEGWKKAYVVYALANDMSIWMNAQGIELRNEHGWQTIEVDGKALPCDPLLYPLAMFKGRNICGIGLCDEEKLGYKADYAIPAFAVPRCWRWLDADGNEFTAEEAAAGLHDNPVVMKLLWPDTFDPQSLLGNS